MSAKEERYCTLRHARNKSIQANILKNSPKHGYAHYSVSTLSFLCNAYHEVKIQFAYQSDAGYKLF